MDNNTLSQYRQYIFVKNTSFDIPIFSRVENLIKKNETKYFEVANTSYNEISSLIDKYRDDFAGYDNYIATNIMLKPMMKASEISSPKGEKMMEELDSASGLFDMMYCLRAGKKFIIHTECREQLDFDMLPDLTEQYPIVDYMNNIGDMFLSFSLKNEKYSNFYVRIMKTENIEVLNGVKVRPINITFYLDTVAIVQFSFYVEKNKFIFIDTDTSYNPCNGFCQKCHKTDIDLEYSVDSLSKVFGKKSVCKLSKRMCDWGFCYVSMFQPFKILSLCAYVWDMYENRKNINRKNSPKKRVYERNSKISIADTSIEEKKEEKNKYSIINLNGYYKYEVERERRKGTSHSFHKSPAEHERRGHLRTYRNKDGSIKKVIEVKPSIINKGKTDTSMIYRVKI